MTDRELTLAVWAAIGAIVAVLQVVAIGSGGALPGLGTLVDRVTARRVGLIGAVLVWMWLGWHAFAR